MSKQIRRIAFLCLSLCIGFGQIIYANSYTLADDTEITGRVTDTEGEPLVGVNIRVKDRIIGTSTDFNGNFSISVAQDPPITLIFSIVGFQPVEVEVTTNNQEVDVIMEEQTIFGSDVVISASRVEESILQSPVSIEKIDVLDIQATASTNFYDAIGNLKGVDFSTQSLTFKSINTRGFAANGNTRFVQLIDGIDNQAPGLNFAVGNVVGISELDLESVELIPGAASALYGPNAINGILLMNSKSAFDYQGLSVNIKTGVNHIDSAVEEPSLYQSYSARYAKSFNNKFAFKVNASYLRANDFVGEDYRDQSGLIERGGSSRADAAIPRLYDGTNVYGDFTITVGAIADIVIAGDDPAAAAQTAATRTLYPDGIEGAFTPTGYRESSFVDNTTESLKLGGALHYRINDNYELVGQYNIGYGSTVYTANDRFVLDDFSIWTGKLELRNPDFYLRAYTTQENSGDSYAANTLASLINQQTYLTPYFQTFAGARTQGASVDQAHAAARAAADAAQLSPDSQEFKDLAAQLRETPISEGGAKFLDKSNLYHAEGFYNFANVIDPEQVQVVAGVNVRRYALESQGTLFALQDNGDEFDIDEWGAFAQFGKQVMDGDLDLSASFRYDKNEYFDGQLSPRASAILTVADNHNIRASFQRGFRIPTTQDQFIDLDVVSRRLIGSNPALVDRYNFETNTVYTGVADARAALAGGATINQAMALVEEFEFEDFQPEKIQTWEVGYKSLINNRLFIDAYYYFSEYTDFIAEVTFTQGIPAGLTNEPGSEYTVGSDAWKQSVITQQDPNNPNQSFATQSYGFDINADGKVRSHGFAVTADYSLSGGYTVGGNISYNKLLDQDDLINQGFRASYNTPEWRYNVKFANRKVTDNLGFNVTYRWQDAYVWESSIGDGVIEAFGTVDAQISYKLDQYKTILKIGGSNLLNERYTTSLANPSLGAIYYFSLTFDQFLN
ncbi:MAG: TonB-dependent receptor [Balneolaceae bacterium]|nr:TonB-dependent receptor [Balneolaceae bacterium]